MIKKIKIPKGPPAPKTELEEGAESRLERRRYELRALNLYLAGKTPAEIGELLDPPVTPLRAHQIVERAIKFSKTENVSRIKEREDMRLDALTSVIWNEAMGYTDINGTVIPPDKSAMSKVMELMEMKAKLHGLNSPVEIKMRDGITEVLNVVKKHADPAVFAKIVTELAELGSAGLPGANQAGGAFASTLGGLSN